MHGKIVPNWMWEYTIYCVNYLLILIQFILVITIITAITAITVIMAINARMANTLFPDAFMPVHQTHNVLIPPVVTIPAPLFAKMYINTMHMPPSRGFKYIVQGRCSISHYPEARMLH